VASTRSAGHELPRGRLDVPRRKVPLGYTATDSLTPYCFVCRLFSVSFIVWLSRYCLWYCFAAESIISLTRYRLPLYLCCKVGHFVSALPLPPYLCYNVYHFVNALPFCLCIKVEYLVVWLRSYFSFCPAELRLVIRRITGIVCLWYCMISTSSRVLLYETVTFLFKYIHLLLLIHLFVPIVITAASPLEPSVRA